MGTGNRELDLILGQLSGRRRQPNPSGLLRRIEFMGKLMDAGVEELQRARRLLGELEEELAAGRPSSKP